MAKSRKGKLVLIHWLDHFSTNQVGWKDAAAVVTEDKAADCFSVGWVLKDGKKTITLVSSLSDGDVDGDVTIVKKAIAQLWELEDPSDLFNRKSEKQ